MERNIDMEFMAFIGIGITVLGGIGFLIAAFKESVWWLIACILISPISLLFLVLHWPEAKNPFFLQLVGLVVIFISAYFGAVVAI
tara:strand:+ start:1568 stop:1822 length:255 start_codon:yes stop_codon:yes gene_type:complete